MRDKVFNQTLEWLRGGRPHEGRFDMETWRDVDFSAKSCGTILCIGGYMAQVIAEELGESLSVNYDNVREMRMQVEDIRLHTGMTKEETDALFFPDSAQGVILKQVTPKIAAEVLERFKNTGEIVWPDKIIKSY